MEQSESRAKIGKGEDGLVRHWLLEIELADKTEKDWRKDAERIIDRYRADVSRETDGSRQKKDNFNILWSNTETLRPALYNSTPKPDVRRRYRDADPIGKAVSQVVERALSASIDAYDFDDAIIGVINDILLPGRGVARVRYVPTFKDDKQEEVAYEDVTCEHVQWDDFRRGHGRTWNEVEWVAFTHKLDKDALKKLNPELADEVSMDVSADTEDTTSGDRDDKSTHKRATVYEIWDRKKREVIFIAKSLKQKPLKVEKDPLGLKDFFPLPRPVYAVESTTSLIPVPLYVLYETLADELDTVTRRIILILKGLRLRGVYDSRLSEVEKVFEAGDNKMIPAENVAALLEAGGLEKAIWTLPVERYIQVVRELYTYRQSLIQSIYELTGISDIMRGSSVASETATAQQIKSQWGSLRLQRMQKDVQRFIRDLMRIKAEIICERFSTETLSIMTGLKFPTQQEKQAAQQQAMFAQQNQQPVDPMLQATLELPSWEELKEVMQSDVLREFRVDIETDSTIQAEAQEDQKNIVELIGGITQFIGGVAPAVQSGALPMEAAKALLMAAVRRFKLGREVEDELSKMGEQPPQQPDESGKAEAEAAQAEAQIKMQGQQMDLQHKQQMNAMDMERKQAEHKMAMEKLTAESGADMELAGKQNEPLVAMQQSMAELQQGIIETNASIAQSMGQIAQSIAAMSAPKQFSIVRNPDGSMTGVAAPAVH